MATYTESTIQQGTYEIRKWVVDFTNDLPSGITVASGTAYHIPPSGSALPVTITVASPYVYAQIGTISVTGPHYLDVVAVFSNGEYSQQRIAIPVGFKSPVAREGMLDLIETMRSYCDCGLNDYQVAGIPYWTDAQIQNILDNHRLDVIREPLLAHDSYTDAGVYQYLEYRSAYSNYESGTAYFRVQNGAFVTEGTANYTADYTNGIITFNSDTAGSVMYLTGRSYNLNAAAAQIWRMKAANASSMYDFKTDNHDMKRSQYMAHCMNMVKYYNAQMGVGLGEINRGDLNA